MVLMTGAGRLAVNLATGGKRACGQIGHKTKWIYGGAKRPGWVVG